MGIFALFVYLLDAPHIITFEAIFLSLALTGFYFYTIVESYNKAKALADGESSTIQTEKDITITKGSGETTDPLISATIMLFGILFLLINFDIINWNSIRSYWPIVLIILGGKLVYNYFKGGKK